MSIPNTNRRKMLAVLEQFFFVFPGKLKEKFIVLVKLATGSPLIVAIAGCQDREQAKAQAISELMAGGYPRAEIISCAVYSTDDLEALGLAANSITRRKEA